MALRPASDHSIRRSSAEALAAGPLTTDDLISRFSVNGPPLGPDGKGRLAEVLDSSSQFVELEDEFAFHQGGPGDEGGIEVARV